MNKICKTSPFLMEVGKKINIINANAEPSF